MKPAHDNAAWALSPLDGRYAQATAPLAKLFCGRALTLRRYQVELSWLARLSITKGTELQLDEAATDALTQLTDVDPDTLYAEVVAEERTTNHDVKALEYCIARRLEAIGLAWLRPWVHFGLTSWDINNLAYALMLQEAQHTVLVPALTQLCACLNELACTHAATPMLGRTHSQPAAPTTLGKELRVFERRLQRQLVQLREHVFDGKLNGAVGNYSALVTAIPAVDWPAVAAGFVRDFDLNFTATTTQIEPYDGMVAFFELVARSNRVVADLAQDLSLYAGYGYLVLPAKDGEVGSSTMPHKTNPIAWENAEGNIAVANALLGCFGDTLQVSRLQRDLSDSTVLRNIGVALGHTLLAWQALGHGLNGVTAHTDTMATDLDSNWQVLGEALQTVLRTQGQVDAYDLVIAATRGRSPLDKNSYHALVNKLVPTGEKRQRLLALSPATYLGLATQLAQEPADKTANPSRTK